MKKLVLALFGIALVNIVQAQINLPKGGGKAADVLNSFIKPPAIGNVDQTTSGIVGKLIKDLALPGTQKDPLTSAIGGFLKEKQGIMGLANTKPADYLAKFNPLQKGLFGKLKGIMGAAAFSKFLGMKPSGNGIAGNLLSNLFF